LPSFNLLYFMDSIPYADLTIKVIAHQWYWTYEYPNYTFLGGQKLFSERVCSLIKNINFAC
jgi:heme/copper-type cytochrome/quinol oxidase subunit 2